MKANVIETSGRRNNSSRIANDFSAMNFKNELTIYVGDCQCKPMTGTWVEISGISESSKSGIYYYKTATFYGKHEVWKLEEKSDKTRLMRKW